MYRPKEIFFERHWIAKLATEDCNKIAKTHGFNTWIDWYIHELKNKDLDLYYRSSWNSMMIVRNNYLKRYKKELRRLGFN